MRHIAYKYEKNNVNLDFSFPDDEKLNKNKYDFMTLLKQAVKDLEEELDKGYVPEM